jgi:hypothetical protein
MLGHPAGPIALDLLVLPRVVIPTSLAAPHHDPPGSPLPGCQPGARELSRAHRLEASLRRRARLASALPQLTLRSQWGQDQGGGPGLTHGTVWTLLATAVWPLDRNRAGEVEVTACGDQEDRP